MTPRQVAIRNEMIRDLHALADWLAARPDVPVGEFSTATLQYSVQSSFGPEAARVAEVKRVAALMGATAEVDEGTGVARLHLGRCRFTVHTMTDRGDAIYDAEASYRGAIQPEPAST